MFGREVIELPNIPSEYEYIRRLFCGRCGGQLVGRRVRSRNKKDRMHDYWNLECRVCKRRKKVILSVPAVDIFDDGGLS
jgi:RNase P subunit RPR2